jgi:hypothetical protein
MQFDDDHPKGMMEEMEEAPVDMTDWTGQQGNTPITDPTIIAQGNFPWMKLYTFLL